MPLEVLDIAWPEPRPQRARERPARLCLEGQPQRPRRPQGPRAQPRRAGARVEADRRRPRRGRQRQPGGDARGRGQRRHDDRPGPGALRAAGRRAAGRRADERAAVRAAALRRARPTRCGGCRGARCSTCPARSRSAPTSAAGWSIPTIRGSLRTQNARLESAVTGMVIDQLAADGALLRPAADLQPARRADAGGGIDRRAAARSISPAARPLLDLTFNANQALLLDRDDIAARVTGPLQIRSDGRGRHDLAATSGSTRAASSSAGRAPRRRCRSSRCAHRGLDAEDVIEVAAASAVEARPRRSPAAICTVRGLGIDSRWTTDLDDRRDRRRAALHRPRRPGPRRL